MTTSFLGLLPLSFGLWLIQILAALPWLLAIDPTLFRVQTGFAKRTLFVFGGFAAAAIITALYLNVNNDPSFLTNVGRIYAFVLQMQLSADCLVLLLFAMLRFWPKGGPVALAAFRESVRQPMYWILSIAALIVLLISPILPYFTFGEDLKMLKDVSYFTILTAGALFCVLTASISINEEIEGRTAITVMSKPISRRHFLLGKFAGIYLAAAMMIVLLSWMMIWMTLFYDWWTPKVQTEQPADPFWIGQILARLIDAGSAAHMCRGALLWIDAVASLLPGFIITGCQVMVLLAVAVAFATRLPMIVNSVICLFIYFLGHLTPILTRATENSYPLISFLAQFFNYVLPGLDMYDMGPAVVRYAPLPTADFALYTVNVAAYTLVYTTIALIFGLILFEDRDLA